MSIVDRNIFFHGLLLNSVTIGLHVQFNQLKHPLVSWVALLLAMVDVEPADSLPSITPLPLSLATYR